MAIINTDGLVGFEKGKNAKELGIDTRASFVVLKNQANKKFNKGSVVKLLRDDSSYWPWFYLENEPGKANLPPGSIDHAPIHWHNLAYAEPSYGSLYVREEYTPLYEENTIPRCGYVGDLAGCVMTGTAFSNGLKITYEEPQKLPKLNSTQPTTMSKVRDFFRSMTASPEDRLLKELGLEDPIGTPTPEGMALAQDLMYKDYRSKVIEVAKAMKAEEDAKSKK
jgi:hypothetical protein